MALLSRLTSLLFGDGGGLTKRELLDMVTRNQFSKYLPWVDYHPGTFCYTHIDNTTGFIWECTPLFFAGDSTIKTLEGLFRAGVPDSALMQFVLVAEPHIDPQLVSHIASKNRPSRIIERMMEHQCRFYQDGTKGMKQLGGIPLRNFRLFFSVKFPEAAAQRLNLTELHIALQELLKGARLSPRPLDPPTLLDFTRRLFNDNPGGNCFSYDEAAPIRKQCILADTTINTEFTKLQLGKKIFRCITPQNYPQEVSAYQSNQLIGGVMGLISDADQIKSSFIYSLNITLRDLRKKLHTKCNFILGQQAVGSFAPSLIRKKTEYTWAVDELEKGKKFLRVIPTLWIYGEDEQVVASSLARAKQLWENQGYRMQEDKGILAPLFISSLPCGLYDIRGFIDFLDRDFVAPVDAIASILPVQGDFSGFGETVVPFVGRKGQFFGVDLWAKGAASHNALICAATGVGKSFLENYMVNNYYGTGAKVRIIDIGGSYKKMTHVHGAKYIDFGPGSKHCLNPFTTVSIDDPEDTEHDLAVISPIIAQMCYSSGEGSPTATDMTLLEHGVQWAWKTAGRNAGTDEVQHFLKNFRSLMPEGDGGKEAEERAVMLAFNMAKFCTGGPYGPIFNGPSTFNIAEDDFVVLELEHLLQIKPLFRVVTMQIINAVTQDVYLGDRSRRKIIRFDEAYKFLGDSGAAVAAIAQMIEEAYRRMRKYNGSISIITQSILDLLLFGPVGKVILNNSAFKFFLESQDFDAAQNEKLINYGEFVMEILRSLKSNPPEYSEVFIDSPFGLGVGRLVVDRWNYYVNTSKGEEVDEMEAMIIEGEANSYDHAIDKMVTKYHS